MLNFFIVILLFVLGVIVSASIVPMIQFLVVIIKLKCKRKETIYSDSNEPVEAQYPNMICWKYSNKLIEAEYSSTKYWKDLEKQYEEMKLEEFSKEELP